MSYIRYTPKKNTVYKIKERLGNRGDILGFYKDERGYRYTLVKFYECGHECYIGNGRNLECNEKTCLYKKMSRIRKISHNRPEVKAKMRQINIENNAKPEVKEKHKKFFQQFWGSSDNREEQAQKKKAFFDSEKNRQAHSELLKEYYDTHEEYKEEIAERLIRWRESATKEELEQINTKRIKTMNQEDARERASNHFKEYYSDIEHKEKYLDRVVKQQRNQKNKFEMMFIQILEDNHIEYVWQYPIITDEGKGFVIDFYLPKYELFVNIDGSIHGFNGKIKNALVDTRSASDAMLDRFCEQKGYKIVHVDTRELKGFCFDIKEVIA